MDTLNDYYPIYPPNPDKENLSDGESTEREEYITTLTGKGTRALNFDDWSMKYSDDTWYMLCILNEYTTNSYLPILNNTIYAHFCSVLYENSTKN